MGSSILSMEARGEKLLIMFQVENTIWGHIIIGQAGRRARTTTGNQRAPMLTQDTADLSFMTLLQLRGGRLERQQVQRQQERMRLEDQPVQLVKDHKL